LWARVDIKNALALGAEHKRMLYELRPDIFPPFLTDAETALWSLYYEERNAQNG